MSRIDYAKWNNLDDSDDDTSDKKTSFDSLLQWKRAADNLFERGENENDIDYYKNAQISYQRVVSEIESHYDKTVDTNVSSLLFSCQLNILTCFAKLNDWTNIISRAEVYIKFYEPMFFDKQCNFISKEQLIRLLYFSAYANTSHDTQKSITMALKYTAMMKKMLEMNPLQNISSQIRNDYINLFDSLEKKQNIFNETEENYDLEYYSNKICSLLQNKQYGNIIDLYKKFVRHYQLNDVPNNEIIRRVNNLSNNIFDTNLLTNIFYSYADAMVNLNTKNSSDMADSLVRAAYFCQKYHQKISLYIRAATVYYNLKQYDNAIESYNEVLNINNDNTNDDNHKIENEFRIVFAIAKIGLGSSYIAIGEYIISLGFLEDAILFFENHIKETNTNDFQIYMHAFNCYESLLQSYVSLDQRQNSVITYKKVIAMCYSYTAISSNTANHRNCRIVKEKIAKYSLALVDFLQQGTNDQKEYILNLLESATSLCEEINDTVLLISILKQLRNCYLLYSDTFPFKYKLKQEIICDDNFSERGNIFCRQLCRRILNKVTHNDMPRHLLHDIICTTYEAGILAISYSPDEAIRSFESCIETITFFKHECDSLLLGDIHYHNSFCYFRRHNFTEARNELIITLKCYEKINDFLRLYHSYTLAAVIFTTTKEITTANEYIDKLYLLSRSIGPVVDDGVSNEINMLKEILHAKSMSGDEKKVLNPYVVQQYNNCTTEVKAGEKTNIYSITYLVSNTINTISVSFQRIDWNLYVAFAILVLFISIIVKMLFL